MNRTQLLFSLACRRKAFGLNRAPGSTAGQAGKRKKQLPREFSAGTVGQNLPAGCLERAEQKGRDVAVSKAKGESTMTHSFNNLPACETLDAAWDDRDEDIRDLIQTTPLVYDVDGLPVGYDASQLFGLEGTYLGGAA
jgi:hypothetical protein